MDMPLAVRKLVQEAMRRDPLHTLIPAHRIAIYDAFGPTFVPTELRERVGTLRAGNLPLTPGDRARAQLAILTARHVLPIWDEEIANIDLLEGDDVGSTWDPEGPAWRQDVYSVPLPDLPAHVLAMASEVLEHGVQTVDVARVLHEEGEVHEIFGRNLGYDEEEFPARAWYAGWAAHEALQQALGLGPFNRLQIDEMTTDEDLEGDGAAGAPALVASAGVFEGTLWTQTFDPEKRRAFWEWWLGDAVPAAWTAVREGGTLPPAETAPFAQTVRATIRRVGRVGWR